MSAIEYRNLLYEVSQKIDWLTERQRLLFICEAEGLIVTGSESNIQDVLSLFKGLEERNHLGIDRLEVLKDLLKGIGKWHLLELVEKFDIKRKEYNNLLEQICCVLEQGNHVGRIISMCKEKISYDRERDVKDVRTLFTELEKQNNLGIARLDVLKKIVIDAEKPDLLEQIVEFEVKRKQEEIVERKRAELEESRRRTKDQAVAVLSSAKIAGEKLLGTVTPHCTFRNVAGGMVVVTTWMILRRSSNLEEFVNAFTEAILPLGNTLRAISEGSVCFTIQAENRSALEALWERYQNGTLQKDLQEFLLTEDVKQMANDEEVMVTVEIDEKEYKNACLELTVTETQVEGLQDVELSRKSKFTFVTKDLEGHKCYNADDQVIVKIQAPSGDFIKKKIEDSVDGTFTVSFTPVLHQFYTRHCVFITVNGQLLTGSPRNVQVSPHLYKHVFTFGSRGSGSGQFILPHGISVNENTDRIAVADSGNNRVQIFSADGSYLREFGQKGIKAERLRDPRSVAFTKNGDVIVFQPGKISLFSENGQFIKHIKNKHLNVLMSLSLASDGKMVACDWGDRTIKVLSPDGTELLRCFTAPDCRESLYSAIYHQDMFFASYHGAHFVKVFNKEGVFLYDIGSEGSGNGQLSWPRGIAVDKFNNLIVSDSGNNRLQVFTLDGRFVNMIKEQITELVCPYSISVSNAGQVFVTDVAVHCIHVFQ
ncbi:hypothetical protein ACROYT_G006749 [Oculina patagonica]